MKKIYFFILLLYLPVLVAAQAQYGWVQKAGFPGQARHRATGESIGNRGYMGLGHVNSVVDILYNDWWEYDPGTDTWMQKANFGGGLRYHCASFVIGNYIYVGTGRAPSSVLMTDFWRYDPVANTWQSIASFPGSARRGAVGFAINGYGFVGTGSSTASFYRYDPVANSWNQVASYPGGGRISAVSFVINGKGYVGTGDGGGPQADLYEYNPVTNVWTQKASLPGLPRMEAAGFALNGKGYIGTGDNFSSGTNYQDFWCYNPVTNSWVQVTDFAGSARRYLTTFVIGSRAYAGLGTSGINYADLWEFGSISGVDETSANPIARVFPNPVTVEGTMEFTTPLENASVHFTDIHGKTVRVVEDVNGTAFRFQRGELAAGVYVVSVSEGNVRKGTATIIFGE